MEGFNSDTQSAEEYFADSKSRVCLLDPAAPLELSPEDGKRFDAYLFGGILGRIHWKCGSMDFINMTLIGDDPPRGKRNRPVERRRLKR